MLWWWEWLSEKVCNHAVCVTVLYCDRTLVSEMTNEVMLHSDVPCPFLSYRVVCNADAGFVVFRLGDVPLTL